MRRLTKLTTVRETDQEKKNKLKLFAIVKETNFNVYSNLQTFSKVAGQDNMGTIGILIHQPKSPTAIKSPFKQQTNA